MLKLREIYSKVELFELFLSPKLNPVVLLGVVSPLFVDRGLVIIMFFSRFTVDANLEHFKHAFARVTFRYERLRAHLTLAFALPRLLVLRRFESHVFELDGFGTQRRAIAMAKRRNRTISFSFWQTALRALLFSFSDVTFGNVL